jgi:hypothetical protein
MNFLYNLFFLGRQRAYKKEMTLPHKSVVCMPNLDTWIFIGFSHEIMSKHSQPKIHSNMIL